MRITDASLAMGQRVLQYRTALGLSQRELAARLAAMGIAGMQPSAIVKIEHGYRTVRLPEAIALAHVLGVPLHELAGTPEAPPRGETLSLAITSDRRQPVSPRFTVEWVDGHGGVHTMSGPVAWADAPTPVGETLREAAWASVVADVGQGLG